MKEFNVIVGTFSVAFRPADNLKRIDYKAVVDGENYHYRIVNSSMLGSSVKKEARGRASVEIQYHAQNQGSYVRFEPASKERNKKGKKIDKKQIPMFGETL